MNIGKTKRTGTAEPIQSPVPQKIEQPAPQPEPEKVSA